MRKARREPSGWPVCLGVFMAYVGIALIGFGGWYSLKPSLRWLIYLAGFIVFLAGLFFIWKDLLNAPADPAEPISPPGGHLSKGGHFLGEFELNGHFFKAYELETAQDGRQFRLFSSPQLTPQREAAFIRYIVNEGLVEDLWQGLSKKIEEEATWAFLP